MQLWAHLTAEDKGDIFPSNFLHDVIRQGGYIWVVTPVGQILFSRGANLSAQHEHDVTAGSVLI